MWPYLSGEARADSQLTTRRRGLLVDCRQVVGGRDAELVVSHTALLRLHTYMPFLVRSLQHLCTNFML